MSRSLAGRTVLIVEDEVIIGLMLRQEVERAGGIPLGPVTTADEAARMIDQTPVDFAILDAKLAGGSSAALASLLDARGIGFVVASAYEATDLPKELKAAPFVAKPIAAPILVETLARLVANTDRERATAA
jgi:DNA-binding NtrC family response regulator